MLRFLVSHDTPRETNSYDMNLVADSRLDTNRGAKDEGTEEGGVPLSLFV